MYWPLMEETITKRDRLRMAWFVLTNSRLTNGPRVRQFEKEWSEWLGVKYSLFTSSGSTANSLLVESVKEHYGLKPGDKVLLPSCTWMTNVAPIIQAGLQPIFCDINLQNFSFDEDELRYIAGQHPDIAAVFITHLIGLSAPVEKVREIFPEALIIEDVCESHGVCGPDGKKRGTDSIGSTFSFYFGHHMTTIEGGMVCTNNTELYQLMRMKRSHGMAREADYPFYQRYVVQNPQCDPAFLFMTDGFNFRNQEMNAVLGSSQIKRLDRNIEIRKKNYAKFLYNLCSWGFNDYYIPENQSGNSSFSLPIIPKDPNKTEPIKKALKERGIEYRPIISGNLLRHPAFDGYSICTERENPNVCTLHKNGLYVGNSQFVNKKMIAELFITLREAV